VCRILNWEYNEESTVYGYKLNNNTCPIFVNYHKEENIAATTKFPEKFLNNSQFLWYSKPQRKLSNPTLLSIRNDKNVRLPFFIKKHNGEGTDFYYMGDVMPVDHSFEETTIKNDQNQDVPVVKVILQLKTPVESSLYNYLTYEKNNEPTVDHNFEETIDSDQEVIKLIPLYNFYAAASSFSEMQFEKDYTLIELPSHITYKAGYFACKIIGESMNKIIPNGSICLFRESQEGTNSGKTVLVELKDQQDQDFHSGFTIKKYYSEKIVNEEGWSHASIVLKPQSFDPSFKDIVITQTDTDTIKVVAEFVAILPAVQ
jgi:SOS-response transcriptional repressor LexA